MTWLTVVLFAILVIPIGIALVRRPATRRGRVLLGVLIAALVLVFVVVGGLLLIVLTTFGDPATPRPT